MFPQTEPAAVVLPTEVVRLAVHPHGQHVYALTRGEESDRTVLVIDTVTRAVTATVSPTVFLAAGLAVSPDGRRLYTCAFASSGCVLTVIDTATASVVSTLPVPADGLPGDVAVSADGDRLYVVAGHESEGLLVVLDAGTGTVLSTVRAGFDPSCVAVSPDERQVWVFPSGDTPMVVDTETGELRFADAVPNGDVRMRFTPDGRRAYLTDRFDGSVWSIDPSTLVALPIVDTNGGTPDVAVTPDGRLAVALQRSSGMLLLVDTGTDRLARPPARLGAVPHALAVSPDGTSVHVAGRPIVSGQPTESLQTLSLEALLSGAET